LRRVGALSADRPLIVMITDEVTASAKEQLQVRSIQTVACDSVDQEAVPDSMRVCL